MWRPDLRVNMIVGTEPQRLAALAVPGDVNVISYDSLPWLKEKGPANWATSLGAYAICDESTRIKRTRASWQTSSTGKVFLRTDGGVQTNALAEQAANFTYWANATGTPSPNGLTDLWGQYWYIDGGARLGRSYTAYEQRWFNVPSRYSEFAKPVLLPGAAQEITGLVRDVTTVCKVEDYFNLQEPNEVIRYVEIPVKARKAYRDMKAKLIIEIQDGLTTKTITAQSAGAKVSKLLQIANGFAYYRDEDFDPELQHCEELHTVKLDDIESVLEETGEPLVVVYYYKANLDQLRKRFKGRLRELDKNGKAQDDWNAGKVEILALQYSSGSMGLNLQYGGRNIYLLTPTYRADDYAQVLERLGPLRQMQAGFSRVVNVFKCMALDTEDQRIFDVASGKITFEAAVIDMISKG
jgi:hypothetical protein